MENVTELPEKTPEYYTMAKRWRSDLEFFKIESNYPGQIYQHYHRDRLQDALIQTQLLKIE